MIDLSNSPHFSTCFPVLRGAAKPHIYWPSSQPPPCHGFYCVFLWDQWFPEYRSTLSRLHYSENSGMSEIPTQFKSSGGDRPPAHCSSALQPPPVFRKKGDFLGEPSSHTLFDPINTSMSPSPLETKIRSEYQDLLAAIPAPGSGCHPSLIQPARKGVRLGLSDDQIIADLHAHIPPGARTVSDRELRNTLRTARREEDVVVGRRTSKRRRPGPTKHQLPPLDRKAVIERAQRLIEVGKGADLRNLSPVDVAHVSSADFVRHLYRADDIILIGDQYSKGAFHDPDSRLGRRQVGLGVAPRDTYIKWLSSGYSAPLIWPQTFSGTVGKNKDGKDSYRCNATVAAYRHCIIEFDVLEVWTLQKQAEFWTGVLIKKLIPVTALVFSGSKSIHAWLPVQANNDEEWRIITSKLLDEEAGFFGILKADTTAKTPSQGFRLPGHLRKETGKAQRLLYLDPEITPTTAKL